MKLLLDQGLPRSTAKLLRESGVDAVHTGECGLSVASDDAILEAGRAQGRTVVTLDSDFHAILALAEARSPSVIRVRSEGLKAPEMARLISQVIELCFADLDEGAAVSVKPDGIRVRRLPMTGDLTSESAE
jgi:predicted nuclease of predicted toxin-antitoxin system